MKRKLLSLLLLSLSSIVSFAQTQAYSDSIRCYTRTELQVIANYLIDRNECRELLPICNQESAYKDSVISTQDILIRRSDAIISRKDEIIKIHEYQNEELNKKLLRKERTIRLLKAGWVTTLVVVEAITIFFLVR